MQASSGLGQQALRTFLLHTRATKARGGSWDTMALGRRVLDRLPRAGYDRPRV